jgi:uncharacterized ion transporter superfamily protein YfcC
VALFLERVRAILQNFLLWSKGYTFGSLVVGLASGIIVILEDGKVIDTLLYSVSNSISGSGKVGALSIMYAFQTFLNAIITSGTAKAAMLMPMFREISNIVGLSLQSTVTAFILAMDLLILLLQHLVFLLQYLEWQEYLMQNG